MIQITLDEAYDKVYKFINLERKIKTNNMEKMRVYPKRIRVSPE